jgi:hypothetical protein
MGRKRSSVNVRVTRPAAASKTVPLARAFRIHRLPNGHLGSSTTHKSGITEGLDKPVPSRQDSTPSATEEYYYEEAAAATEGDLKDTEEYQPERGSKVCLLCFIILKCTYKTPTLTVADTKFSFTVATIPTVLSRRADSPGGYRRALYRLLQVRLVWWL